MSRVHHLRHDHRLLLKRQFVGRKQAAAAVTAHMSHADHTDRWACEHFLAIEYEGWHVPLATASLEIFAEFERQARAQRRASELATLPLVQSGHCSARKIVEVAE